MSIFVECPVCRKRTAIAHKICKCGSRIPPQGRAYWLCWRNKFKRLGVVSLTYAREMEVEYKQQVNEWGGCKPTESLTWAKVVDAFLRKVQIEASKQYAYDSERYLKRMTQTWGDCDLKEITKARIEQFRIDLRAGKFGRVQSIYSVNRHIAAGKSAWNLFVDDLQNPFSKLRMYNEKEHLVTRDLALEERDRLLIACKETSDQLWRMVVIAIQTGLRLSNILNLKWSEVDFIHSTINLIQKRGRPHSIPLPPDVRTVLLGVQNDSEWFFPNPRTGKPYCKTGLRQRWKKARVIANIPLTFVFHDLRHFAATNLLEATGDLRLVQRSLGHSQLSTTERYAKVREQRLRDAMNNLPSILTPVLTIVPKAQ